MNSIIKLSNADLGDSQVRRRFVADPSIEGQAYADSYDQTTLWYDAFWRNGRVYLVCPKLINLLPLVRRACIKIDGRRTRISKLRQYRRYDTIELYSSTDPAEISMEGEGFSVNSPVSREQTRLFNGLNAHLTLSLNNDIRWIRDFARYMVKVQDLEAMLLFDNGSTAYCLEDVADALMKTGLKQVAIVSAPFKYGLKTAKNSSRAKFLQTAMLNLARLRFLAKARAVLNADLDELTWSRGGSVFDLTRRSFLGFSLFSGEWRFPRPQQANIRSHAVHDHKSSEAETCPHKYCIVPQGRLKHLSWDVHRLSGLPFKKVLRNPKLGFYHCHHTSTQWKGSPSQRGVPNIVPSWRENELIFDSETRAALDEGLPETFDHGVLKSA
ncbi:hypothetical protein OAF37_02085 [Rubripirellula sp.]|nr:hypothetical protein [Rubripirellula sp.]MDA7875098.1 hypothetical protein [Rhodopirellula sp.]MDA7915033.1 hypothetical protein [bacterium]MDB4419495.1 hypothetical protein [bacterium]MDB4644826.1 hypothetical protein [Rubripirellula sp.]